MSKVAELSAPDVLHYALLLHEVVWNNFFKICELKHLEKLNTNNFPNIRFDYM